MAQHEGAVVGGIGHILQNTFDPAGAREAGGGADVGGAADSGQGMMARLSQGNVCTRSRRPRLALLRRLLPRSVDCGADGPGVAADGGPCGEMTLAAAEALCAVILDD